MRYYVLYDSENNLVAIGTGDGGIEITEEKYNEILAEICEKLIFAEKVFNKEIAIEDVPIELREEVQCRVDEMQNIENLQNEINKL